MGMLDFSIGGTLDIFQHKLQTVESTDIELDLSLFCHNFHRESKRDVSCLRSQTQLLPHRFPKPSTMTTKLLFIAFLLALTANVVNSASKDRKRHIVIEDEIDEEQFPSVIRSLTGKRSGLVSRVGTRIMSLLAAALYLIRTFLLMHSSAILITIPCRCPIRCRTR